jgi:hypothetical protein
MLLAPQKHATQMRNYKKYLRAKMVFYGACR